MDAAKPPTVIQRRIAVAAALCMMAFALVGVRLVDVTILKGRVTGATGAATGDALATRADLLDRNGELLARDLPVHDLYARPAAFWDKKQAARELAAATGTGVNRLDRIFASKYQVRAGRPPADAGRAGQGHAPWPSGA